MRVSRSDGLLHSSVWEVISSILDQNCQTVGGYTLVRSLEVVVASNEGASWHDLQRCSSCYAKGAMLQNPQLRGETLESGVSRS